MKFVVLLLTVTIITPTEGISSAIPNNLLQCYKQNYMTGILHPPFTIKLLLELLRKLERNEKNSLNLRMFTTSLLHSLKFDGIQASIGVTESEFTVPYRASGKQFYKYKLLVDYLTSGKPQLLPDDSVNIKELCLLHEIISNSVDVWERGNEGRACPELRSMAYERNNFTSLKNTRFSSCPLEKGAVLTKWGPVSPGHLVAAVASALQETDIPLTKIVEIIQQDNNITLRKNFNGNKGNISNVWLSTVAGDLGEVTIQQAFNKPKLGNTGIWNSTHLPRLFYLKNEPYDMTMAELLGGIDGLIFANKIKEWSAILSRTRFSQYLDMYYSSRGIAYNSTYRACERGTNLQGLLNVNELTRQTGNVAKLLQEIGAAYQYYLEEALEEYAAKVVTEFTEQTEIATINYNACEQDLDRDQQIEAFVVLDETWRGYKTEVLVGVLSEAVDIGIYGSSLGLINGQSGRWITNVTDSLVKLYEDLNNVPKNSWQTSLRLSKGLETINSYLQNTSARNCNSNRIPRAPVILVMATTATLREDDLKMSQLALNSIKGLYPETRTFYITGKNNAEPYQKLARSDANDVVIKIPKYSPAVIPQIVKNLTRVPNRIIDFYCNNSQMKIEDYVTPNVKKYYEIHGEYLNRANIHIKFKGSYYGTASICGYDPKKAADKICKGLRGNEEIEFDAGTFCVSIYGCSVYFSVEVTQTDYKCAEFDCRYPDQLRLDILTSWTRKSGSSAARNTVYILVIMLFSLNFC